MYASTKWALRLVGGTTLNGNQCEYAWCHNVPRPSDSQYAWWQSRSALLGRCWEGGPSWEGIVEVATTMCGAVGCHCASRQASPPSAKAHRQSVMHHPDTSYPLQTQHKVPRVPYCILRTLRHRSERMRIDEPCMVYTNCIETARIYSEKVHINSLDLQMLVISGWNMFCGILFYWRCTPCSHLSNTPSFVTIGWELTEIWMHKRNQPYVIQSKLKVSRKLDVTPDNLSCRTENGRSAVADLLVSAAPPTPFPKQFAGSQTFDQSMLAYQCQSYSALARLRIGMCTQLAMPDPHGHLAHQYTIKIWARIEPKIWVCVYDVIMYPWFLKSGMCLWRYKSSETRILRKCSEKSSDFQKSIFRCQ